MTEGMVDTVEIMKLRMCDCLLDDPFNSMFQLTNWLYFDVWQLLFPNPDDVILFSQFA